MPNIRYMPKWLAFLIPISLSLAFLGALGCSSDDDPALQRPVYSEETGIANITISQGELLPAYSNSVRNYGVSTFYAPAPDFSVTVTLKDARSRLWINGEERDSGQATPIALTREGNTAIQVAVQAEDSRNSNIVTITTRQMKPTTSVYVYDSIGGNFLGGDVRLSLRDARTNELLAKDIAFPAEAQGTVFLGLDKNRRYNIYARRSDTAMACFADFDPSREDTVTLYSRSDWIKSLPASAPIITDIAFSPLPPTGMTNAVWRSMGSENYYAAAPADMQLLKVTVMAESNMAMLQSIMVNIDDAATPSQEVIYARTVWQYVNEPVFMDGKLYLMTDLVFDLDYDDPDPYVTDIRPLAPGEHFLDIVAYDWANNRTEQKLYLNITNTAAAPDVDLRDRKPAWAAHRSYTYGVSLDLYSKEPVGEYMGQGISAMSTDPAGPYGDTIEVRYETSFVPGFRGYEVARSTSPDDDFKVVRRRAYATPSTSYYASGSDFSAEIVGGVAYYYKMRYYNNAGYSQWSDVSAITPFPSFNVNLVSPAHQAVSNTLWPTFRFKVTNPAMLDAMISDDENDLDSYSRFSLFIRDKNGAEVFKALFNVDYLDIDGEGNPTITVNAPFGSRDWFLVGEAKEDEATGDITIENPFVWIEEDGTFALDTNIANKNYGDVFEIVSFTPGAAYEWNIFGNEASPLWPDNSPPTYAMHFVKGRMDPYSLSSASYSSSHDDGFGATNGYFTLIMHQSAE